MSNILVTGANGQLGSDLKELVEKQNLTNFFFKNRTTLDICTKEDIEKIIKENSISVIINCAAYTAVDRAEQEEETADKINHQAVAFLGELAKEYNLKLIHISTDYVFNGKNYKPYIETDEVQPQGAYGRTKLNGEKALLKINPKNSIIIRTSWVYSSYGNNFVKTMLRLGMERDSLGVIFDQIGTPTYAKDLAQTILDILPKLENNEIEIYHFSNEGAISWYDFAKEIMKMGKRDCIINPIETKDYPTPASRPHYSLLNKAKIKEKFNIKIPYWKDSLKECISKLEESK